MGICWTCCGPWWLLCIHQLLQFNAACHRQCANIVCACCALPLVIGIQIELCICGVGWVIVQNQIFKRLSRLFGFGFPISFLNHRDSASWKSWYLPNYQSIIYKWRWYGVLSSLLSCVGSIRADSRFAPRQWETALLCNDVSHWLGANLKSALGMTCQLYDSIVNYITPCITPLYEIALCNGKWCVHCV